MADESASTPRASDEPSIADPRAQACIDRYWRRNVTLMAGLLCVWAAASLGAGVLFADSLNAIRMGGFPLGFWFAQQGSILIFVVLVLIYALAMSRLDREHHAELEAIAEQTSKAAESGR